MVKKTKRSKCPQPASWSVRLKGVNAGSFYKASDGLGLDHTGRGEKKGVLRKDNSPAVRS